MGNEHKATTRVFDILELVADHNEEGLKFSEIVNLLGESKGTLHPMIVTMTNRNYLLLNQKEGKYHIGQQLSNLGRLFQTQNNILSEIEEALNQVVDIDFVTAFCGVLSGNKVLYLVRKEAMGNVKVIAKKGSRLPASCTAIGKALLCQVSMQQLHKLYPGGLPKIMPNSITDFDVLYQQCQAVNVTGIAKEKEESNKLIQCFSTPIIVDGKVCAAISAALPTLITDSIKHEEIQKLLLNARKEIEQIITDKREEWIFS